MKLLNKITNFLAAVVGTVQVALPVIKEALVDVTRVCGIVFFWTEFDEKIIAVLNKIYNFLNDNIEKAKNILMLIGKKI